MAGIVLTLLIFCLIVVFHEFGHFLFAKLSGVDVQEFAVGLGPKLFSIKGKKTEYSFRLIPLGGFCRMKDGLDPEREETTAWDDHIEPDGFYGKSVWKRILIVIAGPIFNFLLAWILSCCIIGSYGYDPAILLDVSKGRPMEEAGMQAGDIITEINGKKISLYRELSSYLQFHQKDFAEGKTVHLKYKRDGEVFETTITPAEEDGYWYLGFVGSASYREKASFGAVIRYGFSEMTYWVDLVFQSLKMLGNGQARVSDLSGPVGVAQVVEETYQESSRDGWYYVLLNMINIAIMLSANLGVMNLIPLPALDGGKLLLYLIEIVKGKPINPEMENKISWFGMVLLMLLAAYVMAQDILRIIH